MPDQTDFDALTITLGGRRIDDPWDRLRRYCGLPWSGGPPEIWPYRYYDVLPAGPSNRVDPIDVLAAGAVHDGLTRTDLAFFIDEADRIGGWLADAPIDLRLAEADDAVLGHLAALAAWEAPVSLPLLTKVLHRKRPLLVPVHDQHLVDWYRRYTGEGDIVAAWPDVLRSLHHDLRYPTIALVLAMMGVQLANELGHSPSPLRRVDILIRMDPGR